eukprot:1267963-Amphidinium_carterae.1
MLAQADRRRNVRERQGIGAVVEGLTLQEVSSAQDAASIMREASSRAEREPVLGMRHELSEWLYTVHVTAEQTSATGEVQQRSSTLRIVLLATTDKVCKHHPAGEEVIQYTSNLSTFSHVVDAISRQNRVVPYRDSRLTHVLRQSLGGSHRAALVVTTSQWTTDSNLSSLRLGKRVMPLLNVPKAAEWVPVVQE